MAKGVTFADALRRLLSVILG
ncbi:hypothetical protein LJR251_000297 [Rhizobium rhizogenes]